MAGIKKIIEKMKSQPNGIRMAEADKVLQAYGYRANSAAKRLRNGVWYSKRGVNKVCLNCEHGFW